MNEPTEAQIKEFWEWCDLELVVVPRSQYDCQRWYWQKDGVCIFNGRRLPIDLNNLFKYAVPVAHNKLGDEAHYDLMIRWVRDTIFGKDPALALFWAIWEVINNGKEVSNGQGLS